MGLCLAAFGLACWSCVLTALVGWGGVGHPAISDGNRSGKQYSQALRANVGAPGPDSSVHGLKAQPGALLTEAPERAEHWRPVLQWN